MCNESKCLTYFLAHCQARTRTRKVHAHTHLHTHTYAFTHTQTTKQSHVFRVGHKKKEREENKEENLELCVSRGRRRCGIVLLPLPLMHAHAPGRFNSTFDLLWHEIYYTHTESEHSARGNHLHLSSLVRTVENCRLPRSMHTQCLILFSPPPTLLLLQPSSPTSLCLSVASNDENFCPGTW